MSRPDCSREAVAARLKDIREKRMETQLEFAYALMASGAKYDPSTISKMESGRQIIGLDDILIFSALDPEDRGREWMGWGVRERARTHRVAGVDLVEDGKPVRQVAERMKRASAKKRTDDMGDVWLCLRNARCPEIR